MQILADLGTGEEAETTMAPQFLLATSTIAPPFLPETATVPICACIPLLNMVRNPRTPMRMTLTWKRVLMKMSVR